MNKTSKMETLIDTTELTDSCQKGGGLWDWIKKAKGLSKEKNSKTQTAVW